MKEHLVVYDVGEDTGSEWIRLRGTFGGDGSTEGGPDALVIEALESSKSPDFDE